jgi:serine/threonine-protein kinase
MEDAALAPGFVETSSAESESPLVSRARTRVGATLRSKWHLDALLGVGGMAAVYAATHRNGRRAALKLLHPERALDREWRGRFLREGRVANAVGHEGAVKVLDDDVAEDGSVFQVLELLEGESLDRRCFRLGGRLSEKEVLWVADQLLDVLASAHARGIVHRDLKPDNLFLTRSGRLKVLDFGIARLRGLTTASTATHNGGTMGTPAFMAPEQARGLWDEVDAQSDLFAVGATMFTLLSGGTVHDGRTYNEEILSAMTVPARPLASVVPGVEESIARVVDKALAYKKANRWPDAQRMQAAVRQAYRDCTGRSISMAPPPIVSASGGATRDSSKEMSEHVAPAVATPNVERAWRRSSGVAAAFAAGAATVVAIGLAVVRPGYSSAARTTAGSVQAPTVLSAAPAASNASTVADAPTPPEPPAAATDVRGAGAAVAAQKASAAPKASSKPGCTSPYVVDPVTHIKHWKLDCL